MLISIFILFLSAFVSASLFPFGSEAIFVSLIFKELSLSLLLIAATLGNTLGAVLNYFIGFYGLIAIEKKIRSNKRLIQTKKYFKKYGIVLLCFSWLPVIGDPITLIAGSIKTPFKIFLLLVGVGKFLRYFVIGIITYKSLQVS